MTIAEETKPGTEPEHVVAALSVVEQPPAADPPVATASEVVTADPQRTIPNTTPPTASLVAQSVLTPVGESKQFVEVIAPADLMAGYQFNVDAGAQSFLVQVPEGGVTAGQRFNALVIAQNATNKNTHNVPTGRWRDGLFSCFAHGCCHPACCCSFWCRLCALGQVQTRLKLDCCGNPVQGTPATTAFKNMVIITISYFVIYFVASIIASAVGVDFVWIIILIFWVFAVVATLHTRGHIRRKYNIPESCCTGCEDCCCAFWCNSCTVCQMARHTADFRHYPAGCCTANGLAAGSPEIV